MIRLNAAALARLGESPDVEAALLKVGDKVADRARQSAPTRTGDGARSIRAEAADDGSVRVSWDRDHFYMAFHELGTSQQVARPFLRPALDATYTL